MLKIIRPPGEIKHKNVKKMDKSLKNFCLRVILYGVTEKQDL